jgi:hypothetical protein
MSNQNRKLKRIKKRLDAKRQRENSKPKYSLHDVQKAMNLGIVMRQHSKGHLFSKNLKDRCVFCGVTMKTRKQCDYWFLTFMDRTQTALLNPAFFKDDEVQALWLQHGNEYQDIQLPLNDGKKHEAN